MSDMLNLPFCDFVQPFQVEASGLRGRMVRVGPALAQAVGSHDYPPLVAKLLGETVAVALVLSSSLKYDGIFTLQTKGDGPVSLLMADVTSDGAFRCYANVDKDALEALLAEEPEPSLPRLLGSGYLSFTVDQGPDTERYQGITELTGTSLAECAHQYFQQSEQLQTAIVVHALDDGSATGAVMVQQMPRDGGIDAAEADEDLQVEDWRRTVVLMSSVRQDEILDQSLSPSELLYRLFHEDGVRVYDHQDIRNECRCSKEKVEKALRAIPREELDDMFEDGLIKVDCEFCNTGYRYDNVALDVLYAPTEE